MNNKASDKTVEKIDIAALSKIAKKTEDLEGGPFYEFKKGYANNRRVHIFGDTRSGFVKWETNAPKPYYEIYSEYHPNGNLKEKGVVTISGTEKLGVWVYYDDSGKKTEVNYDDVPARKFTYQNLLDLMQKKGALPSSLPPDEVRRCYAVYDEKENTWRFATTNEFYLRTEYLVNAATGEIISKETYQDGLE